VVHQKEKIFNSTVLDNIVLSSDPKEIEAKILVMQALGCLPLFQDLSQGLLTLCGEKGRNLSGGQRQLIGLARAIVSKPKILILDEATSSMDFELERAVLALVHDYVKDTGAGILLITHHAGLAANMDRVMILEQGQISDHGIASEMVRRENLLSRAFLNVSEPNWR
jgi:ATP-binding cassette subfamily B protein